VLNNSRGSLYYKPRPVSAVDLAPMRRMDELHLQFPFAGARMLQGLLAAEGEQGGPASCENADAADRDANGLSQAEYLQARARPQDLSLSAAWPCGRSAEPGLGHTYHLRAHGARLHPSRCRHGLVQPASSVVASVDMMEAAFCVEALEETLARHGNPQIFNTDQGSQFTCHSFTDVWSSTRLQSAWTAGVCGAITCSSSASGAVSNTRRCI
jgi:putative transposase